MPRFKILVTEVRTGVIIIDDEPTLEAAYARAKSMNVWTHTSNTECKTSIQVSPLDENE